MRSAPPPGAARVPVVVELFTSEGCSSCPPADALLIQLEAEQRIAGAQVVVLGQHVDYWNRLGWTDPFSSAAFTRRQNDYAEAFGRDSIYTPQMVVDGQAEFVGSDAARAQAAITRAAGQPKIPLDVAVEAGPQPDKIRVLITPGEVPSGMPCRNAEVFLALTERNLSSSVARGENSGRHLQHTGVVRALKSLGPLAPGKPLDAELRLAPTWKRQDLSVVAWVQDRSTRRILGAGIFQGGAR
jgi:hypothetical protein